VFLLRDFGTRWEHCLAQFPAVYAVKEAGENQIQALSKAHQELIEENAVLKQRIRKLEKSEADRKSAEETCGRAKDNTGASLY